MAVRAFLQIALAVASRQGEQVRTLSACRSPGTPPDTRCASVNSTAAVRCCAQDDLSSCVSICTTRIKQPTTATQRTPRCVMVDAVTRAEAAGECAAHGLRLCTASEALRCCKSGCSADALWVWVDSKPDACGAPALEVTACTTSRRIPGTTTADGVLVPHNRHSKGLLLARSDEPARCGESQLLYLAQQKAGSSTIRSIMVGLGQQGQHLTNGECTCPSREQAGPSRGTVEPGRRSLSTRDHALGLTGSFSDEAPYCVQCPRASWFTVFREPRERVLSAFKYCTVGKNSADGLCVSGNCGAARNVCDFAQHWGSYQLAKLTHVPEELLDGEIFVANNSLLVGSHPELPAAFANCVRRLQGQGGGARSRELAQLLASGAELSTMSSIYRKLRVLDACGLSDPRTAQGRRLLDEVKRSLRGAYRVVGLLNRWNETLQLLVHATGCRAWQSYASQHVNSVTSSSESAMKARLDACMPNLQHLFAADLELYAEAEHLFKMQINQLGIDMETPEVRDRGIQSMAVTQSTPTPRPRPHSISLHKVHGRNLAARNQAHATSPSQHSSVFRARRVVTRRVFLVSPIAWGAADDLSGLLPFHYQAPGVWAGRNASSQFSGRHSRLSPATNLSSLRDTCNATHEVKYIQMTRNHKQLRPMLRPGDILVWGSWVNADSTAAIKKRFGTCGKQCIWDAPGVVRVVVEWESPANSGVTHRDGGGFHARMGYDRRADLWQPYARPSDIWAAVQRWQWEPNKRRTLGLYVSHCNVPARDKLLRVLTHSDLPGVESYGRCERTMSTENGRAPLAATCGRHRLILAIENSACPDYVSEKLQNAVDCGAIPIVRSVHGVPAFTSMFGDLPWLDAGELQASDFLSQVRKLLTDDSHYKTVWDTWVRITRQSLDKHGAQLDPEPLACQLHRLSNTAVAAARDVCNGR